jgi:hypothetical protein
METSLKNMESNPEEKETILEQHIFLKKRSQFNPKKRRRLSPIQDRCSPWRSIKRSRRKKPQ